MSQLTDEEVARLLSGTNPYAQPRPELTDEDVARMLTPLPDGSDPNAPSRLGSVARGFVNRAGEIVSQAGDLAYKMSLTPDRGQLESGPEVARTTGGAMDAIGAREATDRLGRALEGSGEYMAEAAVTAPMVASGAARLGVRPAAAVLAEMGAAGLGGAADRTLSDEGHPVMGAGAGIAGAMAAAPVGIGVSKVGDEVRDVYNALTKMTPDAQRWSTIFAERGTPITADAMVRGSGEMKRRIPDVRAYLAELRKRRAQTAGLPGSVNSRQIADAMPNERGGAHLAHMDEQLAGTDIEYSTKRSRDRADFLDYLANEWEKLSPAEADYARFLDQYAEGSEAMLREERQAWQALKQANPDEVPTFSIEEAKDRVNSIIADTRYKRDDIPKVLKDLVDEEITPESALDFDRFQELRSKMLGVMRDARYDPSDSNRNAARMAGEVLDVLQQRMDEFDAIDGTGMSDAWQRARELTTRNKELYDPDSPVVSALERGGTDKSLLSRVRTAKGKPGRPTTPVQEAQRLMRIAEQSPGGVENLRAMARDDLFYDGLNPTGTRVQERRLVENEDVYRVILGDEMYENTMELIDLSRLGTRGAAGTANSVARTGSKMSPAKFLFGLAESATNPVQAAVKGALDQVGDITKDDIMWQAIARTAMDEPPFMQVLLEMPTEATLPAWRVQWGQLLARATARAAARRAMLDDELGGTP